MTASLPMIPPPTDTALLQAWTATADREALGQLFARWQEVCFRVARRFCPHEAEDALQDALLAAMRHAASCRGEPGPWLVAITANAARMRARAAQRKPLQPFDSEPPDQRKPVDPETVQLVRQAIDALPDHERQVLQLRYEDDLPPRLIATALGMSAIAVRVRLHRGLQRLRQRLQPRRISGAELSCCLLPAAMPGGLPQRTADIARNGPAASPKPALAHAGTLVAAAALLIVLIGVISGWRFAAAVPSTPADATPVPRAATIADTMALVRPFRFAGDNLYEALHEILRRIPADMPLRCAVATGYDFLAKDPGPGTDQRGLLFWSPQRADGAPGDCTVRVALDQVASAFGYRLTLCDSTAVLHRSLAQADILRAEQGDPTPLQDDPQAWIRAAEKALDDPALAERISQAGLSRDTRPHGRSWENMRWFSPRLAGDPVTAGWPVPPAAQQRARAIIATPTASWPQVEIAVRLIAASPRTGDAKLMAALFEHPRLASLAQAEPLQTWQIRTSITRFLAAHPDPQLADWCRARIELPSMPDDIPAERHDDAVELLDDTDTTSDDMLRAFVACGGQALTLTAEPLHDHPFARQCIWSMAASPRGDAGPALHGVLRHPDLWAQAAATAALLARGDAGVMAQALALGSDARLTTASQGMLTRAAIRLAAPADAPALHRLVRTALLNQGAVPMDGKASPGFQAAWTLSALVDRGDLGLWKAWIAMLGDPGISDQQAASLVTGIIQHRLDEADAALALRFASLPASRSAALTDASQRRTPLAIPIRDLVRSWMEAATPQTAMATAISIAGEGREACAYLRHVFTDPELHAWQRGAALIGMNWAAFHDLAVADIEMAAQDPDGYMRAVAMWSKNCVVIDMQQAGLEQLKRLTAERLASFDDPDPRVRAYAALAIINGSPEEIHEPVERQLARDASPIARQAAAIAVATSRGSSYFDERGREQLERSATGDPDPSVRALCRDLLRPKPTVSAWPLGDASGGQALPTITVQEDPRIPAAAHIVLHPPQWTERADDMPVPFRENG